MSSEGPLGGRRLRSAEAERERRGHGVADAVPAEPIPLPPRLRFLDVSCSVNIPIQLYEN